MPEDGGELAADDLEEDPLPLLLRAAGELTRRMRDESPQIASGGAAAEPSAAPPDGTLNALLREAYERDTLIDFMPLLSAASRFRPAFASKDELERLPSIVSLARGDATRIIGIPSFLAGSGPHQFARLASGFDGGRSVSAFSLPGFRPGEAVPASWETVIDALAASVHEAAADEPFALAGYSIGGAMAHALAHRLEADGLAPAAVILLDTYAPSDPDEMRQVFGDVMGTVLDMGHEIMSVDDHNLVAMGAYVRLLTEWEPQPIEAPGLLVRASQPLGDAYEGGRLPWWQLPQDVVEVEGHHFGLIDETASTTAQAIDAWARERVDQPHAVQS